MQINVFYTCDDNYVKYAGVSICSLLENNKDAKYIRIYVVGDHISEANIARLEKQVSIYNRDFRYIDGTEMIERMRSMNVMDYRGSNAPNLRLFYLDYVEEDVDRLLYLDCDTIVEGDISPLFTMDMCGKAVSVCMECLGGYYKKILGYSEKEPYFNAGMILFDVEKWKKDKYQERLYNYLLDDTYRYPNRDQDYMNLTVKDHLQIISPRYNFQPIHLAYDDKAYFMSYPRDGYYSQKEIEDARDNPVILHTYRFLGRFPWHKHTKHPFFTHYKMYVDISQWPEAIYEDKPLDMVMKIENMMYSILPRFIFLKIFCYIQNRGFRKEADTMRKDLA